MKSTIYTRLALLLVGMSAAGCAEKLAEYSKGETELKLAASQQEIALDERNYNQTALKLSWTTGTNYGTSKAIDYVLEIAPQGTEYADGYRTEPGRRVYEQSYTVEQLNELLRSTFGAETGVSANYRARITATVAGNGREQIAEVAFAATPYEPVTQTLYLIGDATPNGESADDATEMKQVRPGYFTWTGSLDTGTFKFITTLSQLHPSYCRNADAEEETALLYRPQDEGPEENFRIAEAGGYTVEADLLNLKISLKTADITTPPYTTLYFVGDATGWSFEPMTQDPVDPFIFRYGAEIGNGEFKFGTSDGSWENMYKTDIENADYTHTTVVFVSGFDPDYKWNLSAATPNKPYKIALDITPGKESMVMKEFTPYKEIGMVGDATPAGWSVENPTLLDTGEDAYTFTWTGHLDNGELKFTCDRKSDWSGAWFMPGEENKPLAEGTEVISFLPENSGVDRKWKVTAGNYTIELNQLTETLTVTKN